MEKIKIDIPATEIAIINVPVRITDINYGNHLGNDSFVSIIHEARMQWLRQHNYTELNVEGVGLIMSGIVVEFKNESFYGDAIEVKICAGDLSRAAFELYYEMTTKRTGENITLAKAKTGMVCYDYTIKKVVEIPARLKLMLTAQ